MVHRGAPLRTGRRRLTLTWIALLGLLVPLLAGCGGGGAARSSSQPAPKTSAAGPTAAAPATAPAPSTTAATRALPTVRVATGANVVEMASTWAAQAQGFFRQNGLNVQLVAMPNGSVAMSALLGGHIDFLLNTGPPTAGAALTGADVVVVATFYNHLLDSLMVSPAIRSAQDLRGKTIGIDAFGTPEDAASHMALAQVGVPYKAVKIITLGSPGNVYAALVTGHVDAGITSQPFTNEAIAKHYTEIAALAKGKPFTWTGVTTTEHLVQQEPDVITRFLKAEIQGAAYVKAHPTATEDLFVKHMRLSNMAAAVAGYRFEAEPYLEKVPTPSLTGMKAVFSFLALRRPAAATFDVQKVVDPRFVQQIEASGFINRTYAAAGVS